MRPFTFTLRTSSLFGACFLALLAGCATTAPKQAQVASVASIEQQKIAQVAVAVPPVRTLKRKVAIGRFSNESRYGKTFLVDSNSDPLGKQASDMLSARLVASQKFLVFERTDIEKVKAEQAIVGSADLVGTDALILGSVTEFGRSTTGKSGFLSATKIQTAHAKVELRLVDVKTGLVFFSANGTGDASTESGEVAGFGSKADYDATLNDRAIGAAISNVIGALMTKLEERPWRTDILKVDGRTVYISGGARQGLKVGDKLAVMKSGGTVKSGQTGFGITLPPTALAQLNVVALFGESETDEGAVGELPAGVVLGVDLQQIYVGASKE